MRKKFQLLSLTLFFLLSLVAVPMQAAPPYQIENASFENWGGATFDNTATLSAPWTGANIEQVGMQFAVVFPHTETAHSGKYCAKLMDREVGAVGITEVSPSWVTLGKPWSYIKNLSTGTATAGTDGGVDFTARPDTMSVWVIRKSDGIEHINLLYYAWSGTSIGSKYMGKNGSCSSPGTHYDEESDIRQTYDKNACGTDQLANQISEGGFQTSNQYANWTQIKIPITYFSDEIPEKMNIILSASNYPEFRRNDGLVHGNYLLVDDVSLIYSSKIGELRINGEPLYGFDSKQTEYVVELGEKATDKDIPTNIVCKRNGRTLSGSEITVNNATKLGESTTITVKAEDGSSTTTYTLTFVRSLSTNSHLSAIYVNGEAVVGFSGYATEYNVTLPYGTTDAPAITVQKAEDAQTVQVTSCNTFPCTAKVTVYAENTQVSTTYNINLSLGELTDNTLQDILINGNPIPGFNPETNAYRVEMPLGTTQDPVIEAVSKYEEGAQNIVITNNGLNGRSTIVVTPPVGNARTYRIEYVITESSYSYLKDIQLDGVSLDGFEPTTQEYNITLPVGTTTLPAITWKQGDAYQNVVATHEGVNGTSRITVTAQNGNITIYRLLFSVEKSTNHTLNNILVDGVALPGFDPAHTDYTYNVDPAATSRPVVTWEAADAYQVVTKNPSSEATAPIEGTTKLTVRAQNGAATVYNIHFTQQLSDNAKLADLQVEGYALLPAFSADQTAYTCALQRGTTTLPAITYVKGDATQTVRVDENGVNGTTKITVKAQTGTTMVYTIAFSVATSSDVTLQDILVDGTSVQGFDPATLTYNILLPAGTTTLPSIEAVKNDASQRVIINKGGVNGTTAIRVIAENGSEQTYNLVFEVEKSLNATLKNILVGGVALPDFDANVLDYRYVLPFNVSQCPMVEAEGYPGQAITITMPQLLGTARIEVQPEEGAKNIYTIQFVQQMSSNNLLTDIQVNGVSIEGFDSAVNDYTVQLPQGTTDVPVVAYKQADKTQMVQVISGGLNGTTQLHVKAEDGTVNTYTITFAVTKSAHAQLAGIYVDDVLLSGFASDVYNYTYTLPAGTTTLPKLTYKKGDEAQQVITTLPQLTGTATWQVVSEDALQTNTYLVTFAVAPKTDASLKDILVDGISMADFDSNVHAYTIPLVNGDILPAIAYQKQDATQQVVVNNQGWLGCTITVTAQDGSVTTYSINYQVLPNGHALLKDIQFYNAQLLAFASIDGFDPNTFTYNITLPWRTQVLPVIHPVAASKGQVITLEEGTLNGTTTIHVMADDGTTEATYQINFTVEQSSDATLSNITVGGNDVVGFDPNQLHYVVSLPYGTQQVPLIEYENAYKDGQVVTEQQVVVTTAGLNDVSTLQVTSHDGSATQTYTLHFTVAESGKANKLARLLVGTRAVSLQDGVFDYTVTLPYGTTEIPAISGEKNYEEQEIRAVRTANGYQVTVVSNQQDVADVVYNITCNVEKSPTVLTGITLKNGAELYPAFDPEITQYVARVTSKEDVEATFDAAVNTPTLPEDLNNNKQYAIKLTNKNYPDDTKTYLVHLHYVNDTIPNGEFTKWTTPLYNADRGAVKPEGWNVPADADDYCDYVIGRDYTGTEVVKTDETTVGLKTSQYLGLGWAGSIIPAFMTTGTVTGSLETSGKTHFEVSGGVTFHNTPQTIKIGYNFPTKKGDGALFGIRFYAGTTEYNYDYIVTTQTSDYKEYTAPLDLDGKNITSMNLIVNATNQFKGDNGTNKHGALVNVDYIRFEYSSTIKEIKVNDNTLAAKSGTTFAATIDAEYVGIPQIAITGEVSDQAYDIKWGDEVDGVRQATIRAYAEDATYTDYTLTVTRPLSTNNTLKALEVEGASSLVFDPATLTYTVTVPCTQRVLPNLMATPASPYASVTFASQNKLFAWVDSQDATAASTLSIVVTPESGEAKTYTLNIEKSYQSDATLKNLTVEGYDIAYNPATLSYDVTLPAGTTALPVVGYEKQTDAQKVQVTKGAVTTLLVTAEDGTTQATYQINFVVTPTISTAQLSMLAVNNGQPLQPSFSSDVYNYTTVLTNQDPAALVYAKTIAADQLTLQLTDEWAAVLVDNLDGATQTYKVVYAPVLTNNALLQNILVNNAGIANFDPLTTHYEVTCEAGNVVDVEPVLSEEGQTMTITYDATTRTYTIVVTSPDTTVQQTYTVALVAPINNNADLAGILVDGVMIDGFDKDQTTYTYTIPVETPKWQEPTVPTIQAVAGSEGQSIVIEANGINAKTYITVTAQDGKTQKVYEVEFVVPASDYAYLAMIAADYASLSDFYYNKLSYEVEVPVTAARPVITFEKGDAFQQVIEIEEDGKYLLEVTAQAGNMVTYQINFVTLYTRNAQLAGITLDGNLLPEFASDKYEYDVELPVGTTILPAIGVISGADGQTAVVTTNGVNGDAVITVTADDGTTTQDYVIHFTVKLSEVDTLLDIQVDGKSLPDFAADKLDYTVSLPVGTRQWPMVTWTAGDAYQTVTASEQEEDTWNKVVTLVTAAQDGVHSQTYTVRLQVEKSAVDTLKDIQFDNVSYAEFDALTQNYVVELPIGTTVYPEVTYTEGDAFQTVTKNVADNVVTLKVVAENGSERVYTIEFEILHSSNASLSAIYVDYEPIDGFDPAQLEYNYELPYGTTEMPVVTYDAGDRWQVIATNSGGVRGNYTIHVVAEDGINEQTYIIHFSVAKSNNALLSDLLVDGVSLPNFDPEIYTYQLGIPYGVTTVPTVEGVAAMETQIIDEVQATNVTEVSTITVTAEDGKTQKTYQITWYNEQSSNAKLNMIYLDGVAYTDFNKDVTDYNVSLPYGTTSLPEITWEAGDADQKATLVTDGMIATIQVEAQDGTYNEYWLYFAIEKSAENRLKNLYINGVPVEGFDPEVVEYTFVYPAGTRVEDVPTLEDVTYELFDPIETVTTMNDGMVLMLRVAAQNGSIRTYVIVQSIALSSNSYLDDIQVNGTSLPGFTPEQLEYTYMLPFGSSTVPEDIVYVSSDTTQRVTVSINQLGMPTEIFVTAEDGSKSVYRIHFMVDEFDPATPATADNVCITSLPNGSWKFTTNCTNVTLYLVTLDGKVLVRAPLRTVDVNVPDICSPEAEGYVYDAGIDNVIAYYFMHNMKTVVLSGKFRVSHY